MSNAGSVPLYTGDDGTIINGTRAVGIPRDPGPHSGYVPPYKYIYIYASIIYLITVFYQSVCVYIITEMGSSWA